MDIDKEMFKNECRVYIGNLPPDTRTNDIEHLFHRFGKIVCVDLKTRRGPSPFAFVQFEDPRDAEDAISKRDGYNYGGYRLSVEYPRRGLCGRFCGDEKRYGAPVRRSLYRVMVSGLPVTGSWQDLKDHMREAGEVCFADVYKDGSGVVEFLRHEDMKYAIKKLDDTRFRSHEGDTSYIRVKKEAYDTRYRSRSRSSSPVRRRRRSPSYSPCRSACRNRSRSRSRFYDRH